MNSTDNFLKRSLIFLIFVLFLLRIPILLQRFIHIDELQHLHVAWSIHKGMIPYRDFFEHHAPLLHFLLTALYTIWGNSINVIFAGRVIMLVLTVGILFLTYELAKILYGTKTGLIAVLILSGNLIFVDTTIEVRPDLLLVLFLLLSLILFVKGLTIGRVFFQFLAGFSMGMSLMSSPKALFACVGIFVALLWAAIDKRSGLSLKQVTRMGYCFLGGFLIPVVFVSLYFLLHGALYEFVYRNFVMNLQWKFEQGPLPISKFAAISDPLFVALGAIGILVATLQLAHKETISKGCYAPLLCTYVLLRCMFIMPIPTRHTFLLFLPLVAIYGGLALSSFIEVFSFGQLRERREDQKLLLAMYVVAIVIVLLVLSYAEWSFLRFWKILRPWHAYLVWTLLGISIFFITRIRQKKELILLLILVGILLYPVDQLLAHRIIKVNREGNEKTIQLNRSNQKKLNQVRYLMDITNPDDLILDGWSGLGVFRPHAYYYYFLYDGLKAMLSQRELTTDIIETLRQKNVPVVIYDWQAKRLPVVTRDYIESHYIPSGVGDIYVLKDKNCGSYQKAVAKLQAQVATNPKDADAYFSLGRLYSGTDMTAQAIAAYERVVELDQNRKEAYLNLGILYIKENCLLDADNAFRRAMTLSELSERVEQWKQLIDAYNQTGQWEHAAAKLQESVEASADKSEFHQLVSMLWKLYEDKQQQERGIAVLEKVLAKHPSDDFIYEILGDAYKEQGREEKSVKAYQKWIKLRRVKGYENANPTDYSSLAKSCIEKGIGLDTALELARIAWQMEQKNPLYTNTLFCTYVANGKYSEAMKLLETQNHLEEKNFDFWKLFFKAAKLSPNEKGFADFCKEIKTKDPKSQFYLNWALAQFYQKHKKPKAKKYWHLTGYLTESKWRVVGPFDNAGWSGFDLSYGPETQRVSKEYEGVDESVRWKPHSDGVLDGFITFENQFTPNTWVAAYAKTQVNFKEEHIAQLRVGSDDGIKVWVNGEEVLSHITLGAEPDQDSCTVKFNKGSNQILVKVCNRTLDWGFYLRITNLDGTPFTNMSSESR